MNIIFVIALLADMSLTFYLISNITEKHSCFRIVKGKRAQLSANLQISMDLILVIPGVLLRIFFA